MMRDDIPTPKDEARWDAQYNTMLKGIFMGILLLCSKVEGRKIAPLFGLPDPALEEERREGREREKR